MSLSEIFILVFGTPSSKYLYLGFPKPLEVGDHVDDGGDTEAGKTRLFRRSLLLDPQARYRHLVLHAGMVLW